MRNQGIHTYPTYWLVDNLCQPYRGVLTFVPYILYIYLPFLPHICNSYQKTSTEIPGICGYKWNMRRETEVQENLWRKCFNSCIHWSSISPSRSSGKRSATEVGTLIITFTFSEEIPFDCDFDCLDRIGWILRFQFFEAQWRVASGLALTITDLETSKQVNVTLNNELQPESDDPQETCTLGRLLSQDQRILQ